MSNIYILRVIKDREAVKGLLDKHISLGDQLNSICKLELKKALYSNIKTASDIINEYKVLQGIYLK